MKPLQMLARFMSTISSKRIAFVFTMVAFASCGVQTIDSQKDQPTSVIGERNSGFGSQKLELVDSTLFRSIHSQAKSLSKYGFYWPVVGFPSKMKTFKTEFQRFENKVQEAGISFIQGRADWLTYRSSILATTIVSNPRCNLTKSNALADVQTIADGYDLARTDISNSLADANSCIDELPMTCRPGPAPDVRVAVARIGLSETGGTTVPTTYFGSKDRSCVDSANACSSVLPLCLIRVEWVENNSTGNLINSRFQDGFRAAVTRMAAAHKSLTKSSRTSSTGCLP